MRHVMFSGAQSPGVIDLQSDFLWRELLFLFYPTNVSVTFTREPHECIAINADWLRWFVIRSLFSQWNASDFAHTVSLISDDWFVVFLLLWRWKNLKKGYPPCEVFKNHTNISLIKVIELQEHVVTNGGLEWQTVSTCFILKLYVEKFKKGACRSIKASVTPAWLWNANAFNFTAGGDSCQRSHWSRWREFLNSNFESLKLKTVLVLETFLNKQLRQPEYESVQCKHCRSHVLTDSKSSSKRGSPRPTMNTNTATKHFLLPICRTLLPISFSSPLQHIFLEMFIYLPVFASVWSKRLMKQRAVCHLCRNNYMEMVFTGHCVAPEQLALNRQRWSEWQRRE